MSGQPKQDTLPDLFRTEPKPSATELRDAAIDRVQEHAGERWLDRALEIIRLCCLKSETFFADDYHRAAAALHLPAPPDPRA